MRSALGTVERIRRYPLKSTGGERLERADIEARGLAGDRLYAVRDAEGRFGSGKNTRRFHRMPGLPRLRSRYPDGSDAPRLLDSPRTRGSTTPHPSPGPSSPSGGSSGRCWAGTGPTPGRHPGADAARPAAGRPPRGPEAAGGARRSVPSPVPDPGRVGLRDRRPDRARGAAHRLGAGRQGEATAAGQPSS
ncbi:MOSC N-terminal beta barrel domain-containing protein [Streptomyces mobaraensis]|uniref:MOSC N-terminal beta barrel domain-containing protein n=1 Tax=Streptomyces mobaraensis TaxID=35621 RepID=UPI00034706E0|nr:MOSC N-terminal beta barrel domain-containing protein [Streptomyces mobaraensis]